MIEAEIRQAAEAKYKDWFLNRALNLGLASRDGEGRIIAAGMTAGETEEFVSLRAASSCSGLGAADQVRHDALERRWKSASGQIADVMDEGLGKARH